MRVAYVCTDPGISPAGTKGASIHVRAILSAFLRAGAEVTLFCARPGDKLPETLSDITQIALPPAAKGAAGDREQQLIDNNTRLTALLETHGPFDLIYERHALFSDAAMAFGVTHCIPTVLEVNAPLLEEQRRHRDLINETRAGELVRSSIRSADRIVAVSDAVAEYAESQGGRSVRVVPNGVDAARFSTIPGFKSPFTIGFVGTLKPWHDVSCLIHALALLRKTVSDARLLIVGDGPERETLQRLISTLSLDNAVELTGKVSSQDVPELLSRMHVGLAPYSGSYPFYFSPLKIYEYMAASLPVIASDVGNLKDVILPPGAGSVVAPDNPAAMADALLELALDPAIGRQQGRRGRSHVIRHASWDHVLRRSLEGLRVLPNLAA